MTNRALVILTSVFIGLPITLAESRPYRYQERPEIPPYLQSLPTAEQLPPQGNMPPAEVGLGTKRFTRPGVEGVRLDWCTGPGPNRGCGPPAAQLFCQNEGFSRAVSLVEEQGVGLAEPTHRIGSRQTCKGPNCSGFLSITCTKS